MAFNYVGKNSLAQLVTDVKGKVDDKMDKANPTGTGAFSLNRRNGSTVGSCSVAEGYDCTASGQYSHSEGGGTIASGYCSHSEGGDSIANGNGSHAEGGSTIANGTAQHVQGQYNIADTTSAHIVGNGTSSSSRSNCHTLDWNGNAWYSGNVTVGSDYTRLAKVTEISNPNLLINPDFKINQRNKTGTITATGNRNYFVDRWSIDSGSVTINADGTLTLNGTISQPIETISGSTFTASASGGSASFNSSTKVFSITASNIVISWAKLEVGSVATPFVPPSIAEEMPKCLRYYQSIANGAMMQKYANGVIISKAFDIPMRCNPAVHITQNGTIYAMSPSYTIVAECSSLSLSGYNAFSKGLFFATIAGCVTDAPLGTIFSLNTSDSNFLSLDAEI